MKNQFYNEFCALWLIWEMILLFNWLLLSFKNIFYHYLFSFYIFTFSFCMFVKLIIVDGRSHSRTCFIYSISFPFDKVVGRAYFYLDLMSFLVLIPLVWVIMSLTATLSNRILTSQSCRPLSRLKINSAKVFYRLDKFKYANVTIKM